MNILTNLQLMALASCDFQSIRLSHFVSKFQDMTNFWMRSSDMLSDFSIFSVKQQNQNLNFVISAHKIRSVDQNNTKFGLQTPKVILFPLKVTIFVNNI